MQFDSKPHYSKIFIKINYTLEILGHSNQKVENFNVFQNKANSSNSTTSTATILHSDDYDVDDSNESDKSINVQEQM